MTNNYKKEDLTKHISNKIGFSNLYSKKIVEDLILIFKNTIKNNNLNLTNIGSFKLISKKERVGRNPKTKENFKISSRRSISFKVSKNLINILNKYE